jgi:L-arabinose transport system ATP-binding protein
MDEIQRVCDAATVLRDGRHIETFETMEGRSTDMIVERMVGRKIDDIFHYRPREATGDALRISGLQGPGMRFSADLSVKKGEIVGLFGLVGAGRSETLKAIFSGAKGSVEVCGKTVVIKSPKDAIRSGIVFCPEDRKKEGIVGLQSVKENINMAGRKSFWINERSETESTEDLVQRLGIKTPTINQLVKNLSGGNQQKTVLARWLNQDISVILLDEPTRGIDVGAKSEIYDIIYGLAEQGVGVLLVSSELPEVMGVCDRILVMNEGRIVDDVPRNEATEEKLLRLALPGAA